MNLAETLPQLLMYAWLVPLASFVIILFFGPKLGKSGIAGGYVATAAIVCSLILSLTAAGMWLSVHGYKAGGASHGEHADEHDKHASETGGSVSATQVAGVSGKKAPVEICCGFPEGNPALATPVAFKADEHAAPKAGEHAGEHHADHGPNKPTYYAGVLYQLCDFGGLRMEISYYIDGLTVLMFVMVSLIASCIHFYAQGYMHDELHAITDHEVRTANGKHLQRPGRYPRFFQYLSLFCFSMFGIVFAGNIAQVFVFWELVGICSYFLIGFYFERKSASTAANKAFIVNRVGDFGMIIGLMILATTIGTFSFGDIGFTDKDGKQQVRKGLFSQLRPEDKGYVLTVPDSMVQATAYDEIQAGGEAAIAKNMTTWRANGYGYGLLVVAGLGIFCGCVGKSAQFPLHVWLPDAMEGPTPVSALVHSATMVAAGVYLVGRFYPVFAPEALLVIAYIGTITLFIAATIAITATDIKRVLAYSTVSQLGFMMLALGVGGWLAGVMHLITHAFFKSLLFMCSGSVIHACHTNDMTMMGGLRHKMPWTAYTMLIGCLAISGAGIPFVLGLSGYYSKDMIIMQAMAFQSANPMHSLVGFAPMLGASLTAFYMFRLWYMTFSGLPRVQSIYDHAHESPRIMYVPLVILSVFAAGVAWPFPYLAAAGASVAFLVYQIWLKEPKHAHADHGHDAHGHDDTHTHDDHAHDHDAHGHAAPAKDAHGHVVPDKVPHDSHGHDRPPLHLSPVPLAIFTVAALLLATLTPWKDMNLESLLLQAHPTIAPDAAMMWTSLKIPTEHDAHTFHVPATLVAFSCALLGIVVSTLFFGTHKLSAHEVRHQFPGIYQFLRDKWRFDEAYEILYVRPVFLMARFCSMFDREQIDRFLNGLAKGVISAAKFDDLIDRNVVDGLVNKVAAVTWSTGLSLRAAQTGRIRQYVVFLAVGTVALVVVMSLLRSLAFAQ